MHVLVYELRSRGCPLSYIQVTLRDPMIGRLVYEKGRGKTMQARLLRKNDGPIATLHDAQVMRISNGCVLLHGHEAGADRPAPRQTWLCANNPEAGKAALRHLRPPAAADMPFSDLEDDDHPLD